ncbi:hypothetical protein C8J57DRAFT_1704808 [Mycena rebaudengoi]|nr:hypothetical protein C8J57DRAFT_1704808 [Mycena rebaudengoi]
MSLASTLPSLSLSDTMQPLSPTQDRSDNSPTVEPLQEQEIANMRAKALQMGLDTAEQADATPRELELLNMVLRLTDHSLATLDPSQLLRQADTISSLISQRDYLTRQIEEDKSRWQSEREGWDRMSEALIMQRNRKLNVSDDNELKRICQNLDFDNTCLRDKLQHTQGRITALEAELLKLKPHLLMQPFVPKPTPIDKPTLIWPLLQSPHPFPTIRQSRQTALLSTWPPPVIESTAPAPTEQPPTLHALAQASSYLTSLSFPSLQNVTSAQARKKKISAQLKKALQPAVWLADGPAPPAPSFPAPPSGSRSVLGLPQHPQKKPSRSKGRRIVPPPVLASDARAEHLLLAARRLGRERAGIVVGVISAERERMEKEKAERERERVEREKERIEREKRNRGGGGYYRERPGETPTKPPAVELGSRSTDTNSGLDPASASGTPAKPEGKGKGKAKDVPTPLDSLLNAARSMMDEGGDENGADPPSAPSVPSASTSSSGRGMMTRRRKANANEPSEASAPKRRRISSGTPQSPTRIRSALDVLADQAAVFGSTDDQQGKTKNKRLADESAADSSVSAAPLVKRKRGRPPNKDKNKQAAPGGISPVPVASSSRLEATNTDNTNTDNNETANASTSGNKDVLPQTNWGQKGRLKAPSRQRDDVESEDEDEGDGLETEKIAEPKGGAEIQNGDHPSTPATVAPQLPEGSAEIQNVDHPSTPATVAPQLPEGSTEIQNVDHPSTPATVAPQLTEGSTEIQNVDYPLTPATVAPQLPEGSSDMQNVDPPLTPATVAPQLPEGSSDMQNVDPPLTPATVAPQLPEGSSEMQNVDPPLTPATVAPQLPEGSSEMQNVDPPLTPATVAPQLPEGSSEMQNVDPPLTPATVAPQLPEGSIEIQNVDHPLTPATVAPQLPEGSTEIQNVDHPPTPAQLPATAEDDVIAQHSVKDGPGAEPAAQPPRSPFPPPITAPSPPPVEIETQSEALAPNPWSPLEDPILDADADGESDPDIDMDGNDVSERRLEYSIVM